MPLAMVVTKVRWAMVRNGGKCEGDYDDCDNRGVAVKSVVLAVAWL